MGRHNRDKADNDDGEFSGEFGEETVNTIEALKAIENKNEADGHHDNIFFGGADHG